VIAKVSGRNQIYKFLTDVANFKLSRAVLEVEEIAQSGGDIVFFARQTVLLLEKVLFVKIGVEDEAFSGLDEKDFVKIKNLAAIFDLGKLQELMRLLISSELEIKLYPMAQIPLILALCKFCANQDERETDKESVSEAVSSNDIEVPSVPEKKVVAREANEPKIVARKAAKGFSDIEKNWQEFLNKVRPMNAHVVALLRSTKPLDYDGESLMLEVFYRFHKDKLEEPKIVRMLDAVLEEVMGKSIKLKFSLAKRESKPTITVNKSDVIDVKADELEMIAQEIFSK
jgi:DNA polymerase III gamma/tau subunit